MNKIFTAIIIDDEKDGRVVLQSLIQEHCPEVEIIKLCNSAQEGVEAIHQLTPDIVFLDISMPHMSGFSVLDKVKEVKFNLIFVTAYDDYALKAIKHAAIDYLLKPVDYNELIVAVNRCIEIDNALNSEKITHFIDSLASDQIEKVILPVREGYLFVNVKEIIRCEANSNYTVLYLLDGEKHMISKTLKDFESQLSNKSFFRIHKSHLINLSYLKKYTKGDGGTVTMVDDAELDVSRRNKEEFLKMLSL